VSLNRTEFRVVWHQCPHVSHTARVLFVEAQSKDDAKAVATDYINRKFGVEWFTFTSIEPYTRPTGGRVIE
jgi:hypothetical protein